MRWGLKLYFLGKISVEEHKKKSLRDITLSSLSPEFGNSGILKLLYAGVFLGKAFLYCVGPL